MREERLYKALENMESALRLLDDLDAPADIGAHLDLAICRLKELVSVEADNAGETGARPIPKRQG